MDDEQQLSFFRNVANVETFGVPASEVAARAAQQIGVARRRAHAGDPSTSYDAARRVRAASLEDLIIDVLVHHPEGLTCEQVASILNRKETIISPRFAPLERAGRIFRIPVGLSRTGGKQYRTRPNRTGHSAVIWYLDEKSGDQVRPAT
jgi:hypothetical protein